MVHILKVQVMLGNLKWENWVVEVAQAFSIFGRFLGAGIWVWIVLFMLNEAKAFNFVAVLLLDIAVELESLEPELSLW